MLRIEKLHKQFDGRPVLVDIQIEVQQGEILALLGQSGCGKTTLLRLIAGLERVSSGRIYFANEDITETPPHLRRFGLMFQDYALFPHLNVRDNIAFGLKMERVGRKSRDQIADKLLELVHLPGIGRRNVSQLSGGERQRVALARSLAPEPRMLMLDEPLGALDAVLRDELLIELRQIIKSLNIPAIYVTHDQREAFAISDRCAIMNRGRIEQIDRPLELYRRPRTLFTAQFLGMNNILKRTDAEHLLGRRLDLEAETVLLHPLGIAVSESGGAAARVQDVVFLGDAVRVTAGSVSGIRLVFHVPSSANGEFAVGSSVQLRIDERWIIPLHHY
jgi:ABC-type Fe3+/spermidine/putrescine transport system ATPase subunit